MKTVLLIGSGGFIGTLARYGLQQLSHKVLHWTFPVGTLVVNLLGCFLIGLIYGFFDKAPGFGQDWKLFLTVGICGGFTTFSSFSYENIKLLQDGHTAQAMLYISASVIIGLMLTYAGIWLGGK